jgi:hypothetical protein
MQIMLIRDGIVKCVEWGIGVEQGLYNAKWNGLAEGVLMLHGRGVYFVV